MLDYLGDFLGLALVVGLLLLGVAYLFRRRFVRKSRSRARKTDFQRFFDTSPEMMCIADLDGYFRRVNPALSHLIGYSLEELANKSLIDFIHPDDRKSTLEQLEKLTVGKKGIYFENRYQTQDGFYRRLAWTAFPYLEDGAIYATARDITERTRIEATLKDNEHRFSQIIRTISDGLLVIDEEGKICFVNPSAEALFGRRERELINQDFGIPFVDDQITEIEIRQRGGAFCVVEMRVSQINWQERLAHLISLHDITERKQAEARLKYQASHDPLTRLPNRVLFFERLTRSIARLQQNSRYLFAVLFLDLDDFKLINDSLGHLMGDELLKIFSQRLQVYLQEKDTLMRLGGDEFTILLDDIKSSQTPIEVAKMLLKTLTRPLNLQGRDIFINASIGIAFGNANYQHPQDILRDADTAMYQAKARGKGCYAIFDQRMHQKVVDRLQLDLELRQALEREELAVYYQPIISLKNKQIKGFEALIRWRHPQKGMISPAHFIPIAEETGLIIPIGYWILRQACYQLKIWQKQFPTLSLQMSVNLSSKQLQDRNLLQMISQILQQSDLDPYRLKLEITESLLIENIEVATDILRKLRQSRINLCLDDFGTGYSSLSYLHRLPFHTVKIDRSFIHEMRPNDENSEIVRAIVSLAHNLGMEVTAEGIETELQFAQLQRLSCEEGQGYYFSPPVSALEIEKILEKSLKLGE